MSKLFQSKFMLTIGEQIRKLREDQGLPLRKVAAELDIDQSVLIGKQIKSGRRLVAHTEDMPYFIRR